MAKKKCLVAIFDYECLKYIFWNMSWDSLFFWQKACVSCCIYRYIHGYVVIIIFEFEEYCFIKWKLKFWNFLSEIWTKGFSIGSNFFSIDRNDQENNLRISGWFDSYLISILLIEKSIWSIERNSQPIKTRKNWIFSRIFKWLF